MTNQPLAQYLADWASEIKYSQLPPAVIKICKKALLDVSAVGIAGVNTRVSQSAQGLATRFFTDQSQSSSLFNGNKHSAKHAAYFNSIAAHALDMDDTCYAGIVHATVVIAPLVLAYAEAGNNSGKDLLTAFVVGSEITYGLGAAVGSSIYENNFWPTGVLGVIGAAAALAKLKQLDEHTTARAIAFAALNASPLRSMQGTDSKSLAIGETIKRAIDAVEVAQTGVSVPEDIFERAENPLTVASGGRFDRQQVRKLGEQWRLIDPGLVVKLYPLCSCAQTSVEALIEIMQENNLDQSEIESVSVITTSMVQKTLRFDDPQDENQAMFSLTYPLACALVDHTVMPEHISLTSLDREDLKSVKDKISYQADDGLFDLNESPEAAIIKVKTTRGEIVELQRLYPTGDPRSPPTKAQLITKVKICIGGKIDVDKFTNAFENIEHTKNINELTDHFKGI